LPRTVQYATVVACVFTSLLSGDAYAVSRNIQYNGFSCDVYADQRVKVLDNDDSNLAYDFNVTMLSMSLYVAVFHAEPYRKAPGCWGDSVVVAYANSPDGYFGFRTGNGPDDPGDNVITRTSGASHFMSSPDCTGLQALSGGANPILFMRGSGVPAWTLLYLSVSDYDEGAGGHTNWWRHYLMVAHPIDVTDMHNCDWVSLANNGTSDYWHWFYGGPPKWQDYQPWPVRVHSDSSLLQSMYEIEGSAETHGLIGSVSYNQAKDKIYYFHYDKVGADFVTVRREMVTLDSVNWWTDPVIVRNPGGESIYYHNGMHRWMMVSGCLDKTIPGWALDNCIQFTDSDNVEEINDLPEGEQTVNGLGLAEWFHDASTNGPMEQVGFLKNGYGHIPGNDFRMYIAERAPDLYGMDMYSVRIVCACDTSLCDGACCAQGQVCHGGACCSPDCAGKQCGSDGCGGSCGACAADETCNASGQCLCTYLSCNGACCAQGQVCHSGACCSPDCVDKQCGSDGCGDSCGICGEGDTCDMDGRCVPKSDEGKVTGGCSCGTASSHHLPVLLFVLMFLFTRRFARHHATH